MPKQRRSVYHSLIDKYQQMTQKKQPALQPQASSESNHAKHTTSATMASAKRPTTTISTIAIKAGDTTRIVIAALKGTDWVRLRIDRMTPGMLECGNDLQSANRLSNLHRELMNKLREKQENIEELLAEADKLVTQQKEPDRVTVYEAMADSLGSAWKDLNKQLKLRGNMIDEAVRFYTLVEKHASLLARIDREVLRDLQSRKSSRGDDFQQLLTLLKTARTELVDVTADALDVGQHLIGVIRSLGGMADNEDRPTAIYDEVSKIEDVMLTLTDGWKRIEMVWAEHRGELETASRNAPLWQQLQTVEQWLRDNQRRITDNHLGNSDAHTGSLLRHTEQILAESQQYLTILRNVASAARNLPDSQDKTALAQKCAGLQEQFDGMQTHFERRRSLLQETLRFFTDADAALRELSSLAVQLRNSTAEQTQSLSQKADRIVEGPITVGRRLLDTVGRNQPAVRGIASKVEELEVRSSSMRSEAQNRGREVQERFEREISSLTTWLSGTGESFLARFQNMGHNLPTATDFLNMHKQLASEITHREPEVFSLLSKGKESSAHEASRQLGDFQQRWQSLKNSVDQRLQLGNVYQQFHKFVQEITTDFDTLEAMIQTNRDLQDPQSFRQMEQMWTSLSQNLQRMKHQGEKFLEDSRQNTDRNLDIASAQRCVNDIIGSYRERIGRLGQMWSDWKTNQISSTKVTQTIEEVEIWIREIVDVLSNIDREIETAKTSEDANRIAAKVDYYRTQQKAMDGKIQQLEQDVKQTHVEENEHRMGNVKRQYVEIVDRLVLISGRVRQTTQRLTDDERRAALQPPSVLQPLTDAQVEEGSRFEFACRLNMGQPEAKVSWYKDGVACTSNPDYYSTVLNGLATLRIDETFVEDSAVFCCRAVNDAGMVETNGRLTVKSKSSLATTEQSKPRFLKQLKNLTVTEGGTARVDCVVVGVPEPEVIWFKEEQPVVEGSRVRLLFEGDTCALVIQQLCATDQGLLKCVARNLHGEATSFCRLIVQPAMKPMSPPTIKYQAPNFCPPLRNQVLTMGQRCMMEVRATGDPSPDLRWFFDERPIHTGPDVQLLKSGDGWERLVFTSVSPQHAGSYAVLASNAGGEARTVATLIVNKPVTPQPPPPPARHYNNNQQITTTTHSETVEEMLTNEIHLGMSPSATAPEFVRHFNAEYRLTVGDSRPKIDCELVGNPRPKVTWYHNGAPVQSPAALAGCQLSNVGDTYSIVFPRVVAEHAGSWQMVAENIRGRADTITRIFVADGRLDYHDQQQQAQVYFEHQVQSNHQQQQQRQQLSRSPLPSGMQPPHFSQTLVSVVCTEGESARFTGTISGSPPPEVQWTLDGVPFLPADHPEAQFGGSSVGADGQVTLSFPRTHAAQSGKYMCTAKNPAGVATSSAQLVVRPKTIPPDFVQELISREVIEGESVRWEVKLSGEPKPKVVWMRNNQVIPHCQEIQLSEEPGGVHIMYVVCVETADAGQFTVFAENEAGEARSTATLVVRPRGTEAGAYFHVTKITQERQLQGQVVDRNQTLTLTAPTHNTT